MMRAEDWRKETMEVMGELPEFTQKDRVRRIIALRYYIDTETYDRTLPGVLFRDEWIPHQGEPRYLSQKYAAKRMNECNREAGENWIEDKEFRDELNTVVRMNLDDQKRELASLIGPSTWVFSGSPNPPAQLK
jgi:hypothetical protein